MPIVCFSLPIDLYSAAAVRGIKVKNQEPRTRNQEPETRIKRAGTREQEPETKDRKLRTFVLLQTSAFVPGCERPRILHYKFHSTVALRVSNSKTRNQKPGTKNQELKTKNSCAARNFCFCAWM